MILKNCDCYKEIKLLPDNSIDLIVTDPPYLLDETGSGSSGRFGNNLPYHSDIGFMVGGYDASIFDEMLRVMKKTNIYIFCSQKQIPILIDYFVKKHGCNWNLIEWHKTNPVPACGNKYLTDTEFCFFARQRGTKIYGTYHTKRTYYVSKNNATEKRQYGHPTIKPLDIVKNLVINSSNENDVVLDPFMGSGTTGVACKTLNRKFVGYEINYEYFKTAQQRIIETLV